MLPASRFGKTGALAWPATAEPSAFTRATVLTIVRLVLPTPGMFGVKVFAQCHLVKLQG